MIKKWKCLFYLAALWNFTAAIKGLLDIDDSARNFYLEKSTEISPVLISNLYIFWWTVLTFGLAYLIVALNPAKNHGIVLIAMLGKAFVGVIWIQGYFSETVNQVALLGGVGDIIFALFFMTFLYQMKNHSIPVNPAILH